MIPVEIYRSKLEDLESVLNKMGKDPERVSDWFLQSMARGQINIDAIREKGMQSISLVESMPRTSDKTILGMKLTEPKRVVQVKEVLDSNEITVREELRGIEEILGVLRQLSYRVSQRIGAIQKHIGTLSEQAVGVTEQAMKNAEMARQLAEWVLPTLISLRTELIQGMDFCQREHHIRVIRLHRVIWQRNWQPKYNRWARRKRLARWKKRQEEENKGTEQPSS